MTGTRTAQSCAKDAGLSNRPCGPVAHIPDFGYVALVTMFILYVSNQQRARDFYVGVLGTDPVLDVPGMTEFRLFDGSMLGLMPDDGIARILGDAVPHPAQGAGIPRCELYLIVDDPALALARAVQNGATPVSALVPRGWGDEAGYCADPDGHILAFARPMPERSMN